MRATVHVAGAAVLLLAMAPIAETRADSICGAGREFSTNWSCAAASPVPHSSGGSYGSNYGNAVGAASAAAGAIGPAMDLATGVFNMLGDMNNGIDAQNQQNEANQNEHRGRAEFDRGMAALNSGNCREAAAHFQQAYDISNDSDYYDNYKGWLDRASTCSASPSPTPQPTASTAVQQANTSGASASLDTMNGILGSRQADQDNLRNQNTGNDPELAAEREFLAGKSAFERGRFADAVSHFNAATNLTRLYKVGYQQWANTAADRMRVAAQGQGANQGDRGPVGGLPKGAGVNSCPPGQLRFVRGYGGDAVCAPYGDGGGAAPATVPSDLTGTPPKKSTMP